MNNEHQIGTETTCAVHTHKAICWSAIFVGALIAVGLGFLLHLYSMSIGLSAYSSSAKGAGALAIGGLLGLLIGVVVSMIIAGYVTGHLARCSCPHRHLGIVYGFTTWSVALILSALMVLPINHFVSAYSKTLVPASVVIQDNDGSQSVSSETTSFRAKKAQADAVTVTSVDMAKVSWIIFILFFIGALSACIGAHCGIMGCNKSRHQL